MEKGGGGGGRRQTCRGKKGFGSSICDDSVLVFLLQEGLESQLNHPDFILTDLAKPEVCVTDHAVHA